MPCRCGTAGLRVLALLGSSFAPSGRSDGRYHHSCEAQLTATTSQSFSLVQTMQVHNTGVQYFEDDQRQSSTGSVLMQVPSAANKTASAEGMTLTQQGMALLQQPSVADRNASVEGMALREQSAGVNKNASVEGPQADWHARWRAWQRSCQNMMLVLAELGNRTFQAAQAFCRQTISKASKAPLTSIRLMLWQAAAWATMSPLGWVGLALGLCLVLAFIIKDTSTQSLGHAESYDVKTFAASAPMFLQSPEPCVGTNLCPGLVVPPACECSLRVPAKIGEGNSVDVTDMNGHEVIRVMFRKHAGHQQIILTTWTSEVLAQCGPAPGTPGEFHILRAQGGYFGKLLQGSTRHEHSVWTSSGAELAFGGFPHSVKVTDTRGRLLAMMQSETGGKTSLSGNDAYLLRVAPLMDVSVVICGMMIVNHLM